MATGSIKPGISWESQIFNQAGPGSQPIQIAGKRRLLSACPRANTPLEVALAVMFLMVWLGAVCIAPLGAMVLLYFLLKGSLVAWSTAALVAADLWLPPGQEWQAFRYWKAWGLWHRYFQMQYITPPLPFMREGKRYMIVQFPHGVYPMAGFLALSHTGTRGSGAPNTVKGSIATVFFQLPVIKHIYAAVGACSAEKQDMVRELKQGHPVAVHPEGIAGIFQGASPTREQIYVKDRKGFVKLAIQTDADMLPMYYLGQSQLLTFWGSEKLSRRFRATVGIFWGWYGTVVPRPHRLIAVVGDPIEVQQSDSPSQEQIDKLHEQLVTAIQQLYDDHRHLVGWQDRPLKLA